MESQGILRMNRGSVITGSCLLTFLVTHKISDKQSQGFSYTNTLSFHHSSFLAPQKPGRSHLMATLCSPKECVDYSFAACSLAVKQRASGINSSRSAPFPGRCQKSDCWGGHRRGGFSEPHVPWEGVFIGPFLAKLWPEDGQMVDKEVGCPSSAVGTMQAPKINYPPSKPGLEGPGQSQTCPMGRAQWFCRLVTL